MNKSRIKRDPNVVELFAARAGLVCALGGRAHETTLTRGDEWRASFYDKQDLAVAMIATGTARLGATPIRAMLNQALLNVIEGADLDDAEDVAMRKSLAVALRERTFGKPKALALVGGKAFCVKFHENNPRIVH
jgi:hypothetical protein